MARKIENIVADMRSIRAKLAEDRDRLRELQAELDELDTTASEGIESLDNTIEVLSREV
jgi:hypothetical protein